VKSDKTDLRNLWDKTEYVQYIYTILGVFHAPLEWWDTTRTHIRVRQVCRVVLAASATYTS